MKSIFIAALFFSSFTVHAEVSPTEVMQTTCDRLGGITYSDGRTVYCFKDTEEFNDHLDYVEPEDN